MRKVYIWERVRCLTENYHHEGGLVVVAASLEDARTLFLLHFPKMTECEALKQPPNCEIACRDDTEALHVFVFPNAGCC
jgi:hypothetical protein